MTELAIRARGVKLAFGRTHVLTGADLEVPFGSATALVGRNGSGKSTLLRILTGLLEPSAGTVSILGLDPGRQGADVRRLAGYVADREEAPPWMRVKAWLRFRAAFHPTWNRAKERDLTERLGLDPGAKLADLSRGQREKLAIAAALAHEPRVLILDEPFSGLDSEARRQVLLSLIDELAGGDRTLLFVSHSLSDVERLADRIAVLEDGRIAWTGAAEELRDPGGSRIELDTWLCEPTANTLH
jgi:ABC-2 type transport system ATP-binding protein